MIDIHQVMGAHSGMIKSHDNARAVLPHRFNQLFFAFEEEFIRFLHQMYGKSISTNSGEIHKNKNNSTSLLDSFVDTDGILDTKHPF